MANPIKIIKEDHRKVEDLFKKFEDSGSKAFVTKREIADKIITELTVHALMEEKIFYPAAEKAFNAEGDKMVEEAIAEHDVVKNLMNEIQNLNSEDPQFEAKVIVLKEVIEHHVKEEEEQLLPKSEKEISKENLERLGDEMVKFKEKNSKDE